jgi:hypothetical protein
MFAAQRSNDDRVALGGEWHIRLKETVHQDGFGQLRKAREGLHELDSLPVSITQLCARDRLRQRGLDFTAIRAHMLALMITHNGDSVGMVAEEIEDAHRIGPAIHDIPERDNFIFSR